MTTTMLTNPESICSIKVRFQHHSDGFDEAFRYADMFSQLDYKPVVQSGQYEHGEKFFEVTATNVPGSEEKSLGDMFIHSSRFYIGHSTQISTPPPVYKSPVVEKMKAVIAKMRIF